MSQYTQLTPINPRIQYIADGVRREFLFPFVIFKEGNLEVYVGNDLQTSGFTLSGAGQENGGSIVFSTPPATGTVVTLHRQLVLQRTSSFQESGPFRAGVLNSELDYVTASLQQLEAETARCIRLGAADPDAPLFLPDASARAGQAVAFDERGALTTRPFAPPSAAAGWNTLDDLPEGSTQKHFTAVDQAKLATIAIGAQPNPPAITTDEKAQATGLALRSFAPKDVGDMIAQRVAALSTVTSFAGRTGAVTAQAGDYTADLIQDAPAKVIMTAVERSKLAGMQAGAQVNPSNLDGVADSAARLAMTSAERTKLQGVDTGAQVNPAQVSTAEKTAGTSTAVRGFAPLDVRQMAAGYAPVSSVAGRTGAVTLAKSDVGLGAVTNDAQLRADFAYTTKSTPAAGDKLLIKDQGDGQPKVVDWNQLPGVASAVAVSFAGIPAGGARFIVPLGMPSMFSVNLVNRFDGGCSVAPTVQKTVSIEAANQNNAWTAVGTVTWAAGQVTPTVTFTAGTYDRFRFTYAPSRDVSHEDPWFVLRLN